MESNKCVIPTINIILCKIKVKKKKGFELHGFVMT
jgi:hypothetical protein